mmetsp:Transcript_109904/g.309982  ORF Transcript_109904/g.309982 Transcript_109904/m.309982 type:complete len:680 (-) Transcript_109904:125-2164(-)|eukprot:CAMPEP_0117497802 /NCGR_PEP_ID=MMETSP0784-20121206/21376_1 /TAXON_ID=39447 /ORGANISM="" /LENGTH=679 /DNA_ID=CAMNT_0005292847 /DNA_START=81 /DNA_END=2120 /DNA_ORIENTATION=-
MGDEGTIETAADGEEKPQSYAIGIDLGTTYSCVGVFRDGEVHIIANDQGNRTTPSYVAWTDQERLTGDAAKNQVANNPSNTVFDAKRLIGRRFADPVVQSDARLWPFKVVSDGSADDKPLIEVTYQGVTKRFHPEEISAMVLMKMKQTAEGYVGQRIRDAVVTVPAYFNDSQRQATKDAGEISGLNVLRVVNEPTAAAIAYGLDRMDRSSLGAGDREKETNILVFDMGGGTFDVSVLTIQDSVFEVRATAGDPHLGGEDFDNRLLSHCIADFRRRFKSDPTRNQRALRRLRTQCERAKRQLSTLTQVTIEVDALHEGNDFSIRISRAKFEELNVDYFRKAMEPVSQCLTDSGLPKSKIHEVVMVGGSTRIPRVQQMIQAYFNGKELCKNINPDEAVAFGAAVQAAIVSGSGTEGVQSMLLLDVAPLSLGIETAGGMMQKLIERNSTIPTNKSHDFTTTENYQTYVDIKVYEGERAMVKDNNYLGLFTLKDIPKTLRGVPKIRVTFNVDSNGILEVVAEDMKTHSKSQIQITNEKGRLTQSQIEKMLREADENKEVDDLARGEVLSREELKGYMARTRRALQDISVDKIASLDRERLESKLDEVDDWLSKHGDRSTKEECRQRLRELESAMNAIMMRINQVHSNFWDQPPELPPGERTIADGGFFLESGFDIRELIEDPD